MCSIFKGIKLDCNKARYEDSLGNILKQVPDNQLQHFESLTIPLSRTQLEGIANRFKELKSIAICNYVNELHGSTKTLDTLERPDVAALRLKEVFSYDTEQSLKFFVGLSVIRNEALCDICASSMMVEKNAARIDGIQTVVTKHWDEVHEDKEQPAKKIRLSMTEKEVEKKFAKLSAAVLSIQSLLINNFLHPLMRRFVQVISPKMELPRSLSSLKKLLIDHFVKIQAEIRDELSNLQHRYFLTCDVWFDSGMNNGYLGVTLHYCDASADLRCVFLGLQQLEVLILVRL
uniref:Uncharacterized protein n=1 Tax=Ditylenchus dipsaci TaxID=166011 RepID=A0A915ETZ8_9BILA